MEKIIKNFTVETKAVDSEAGIYEALITTESPDRMGDVVRASGAKIDNYLKNPVVLFAHDYSDLPVAKTIGLEIIPQLGIRAMFQFPEKGTYEKADTVRQLWAGGFLNATSIGFMPVKSINLTDDAWGPKDFTEWELLEFSIVPVPANADALRLAIKSLEDPAGSDDLSESNKTVDAPENGEQTSNDVSEEDLKALAVALQKIEESLRGAIT
jgi:phage head maturation protease